MSEYSRLITIMARSGSEEVLLTASMEPAVSLVAVVLVFKASCFRLPTRPTVEAISVSLPGFSGHTIINTLPDFMASLVDN
ncbi:hypothetical protein D3C81_2100210 [compost metagenome]